MIRTTLLGQSALRAVRAWHSGEMYWHSDRIKAVLLDLDDTLLINDMEVFSPPYFRALLAKVQGVCRPGTFMEALNTGIRAMVANDGRGPTNAEVFAREFYPRLGCPRDDVEPLLEDFYRHDFEDLAYLTAPDPAARDTGDLAPATRHQDRHRHATDLSRQRDPRPSPLGRCEC